MPTKDTSNKKTKSTKPTADSLDWNQIDVAPQNNVGINVKLFLDKSGSMRQDWAKTIPGVVEYFDGLKAQTDINYTVSLYAFAQKNTAIFEDIELNTVSSDKITEIEANGISTSLYDSLGEILSKMENEVQPYLIVIFTDGEDNSSKTYKAKAIKALLAKLEAQGNYTFVFMGASADSWAESENIAVPTGNRSLFDRSKIDESFKSLGASTRMYSMARQASNATMSTSNFYVNPSTTEIKPEE